MPLIVQGEILNESNLSMIKIVEKFPYLKDNAEKFCSQPVREVPSPGLLYVIQREFATVSPTDENVTIIGSEDATTCHIAILRNRETGMTSIAHFDGSGMKDALEKMIKYVLTEQSSENSNDQVDLYLFGGFLDEREISADISSQIFAIIQQQATNINLCTACVTVLNDIEQNGQHRPIVYGVAMNVKTGEIFQATFPDKGPEGHLRHIRNFTGSKEVVHIYNSSVGEIQIRPFEYKPWAYSPFFVTAPDHIILQCLSTSPHCEPADFCEQTRATIKFMAENPSPLKTVFPDGLPHRFVRSGDKWDKLNE